MFVVWFVCLSSRSLKKLCMNFHETFVRPERDLDLNMNPAGIFKLEHCEIRCYQNVHHVAYANYHV